MTAAEAGFGFLILGLFLLVGKIIRVKVRFVQRLFLPSSIIGGFLLLLVGPQVLGPLAAAVGLDTFAESGIFTPEMLDEWSSLPGLLISIVFATLLLGQKLPTLNRIGVLAGPQLSFSVALASGQYIIGLLLAIFILVPLFAATPMMGALIEIAFEGGHGTAAGMRGVLTDLGFQDGADLALGLATVGIVGGVIIGIALINWAARTGRSAFLSGGAKSSIEEQKGLFREDEDFPAGKMTSRPSSVEPLSLHAAIVALAVFIGWLILEGLRWVEAVTYGDAFQLFTYVPLFPLAMIGGVLVQVVAVKIGAARFIDEQMMLRIQGLALDFLIVSALGTLSLSAIGANIGPFVILAVAAIVFNVGMLLTLAPRVIPSYWFERGIGDFGQGMGVTATGLILMRVADPDGESPAMEAFAYKQLIFEPFFGGGLVTAAAVPLIFQFGPWPLLIGMFVLFCAAVLVGLLVFGRWPKGDAAFEQKTRTA